MSYIMWRNEQGKEVENIDMTEMFGHSWDALREEVMKSSFKHPMAGISCFAMFRLCKRASAGYYTGTRLYWSLYRRLHDDRFFLGNFFLGDCGRLPSYFEHILQEL